MGIVLAQDGSDVRAQDGSYVLDESGADNMAVQTTATVAPCGTIVFVNFVDTANTPPTPVSIVGQDGSSSNYYPFRTTRFDPTKTGLSVTVNGTAVAFRGGQPAVVNAFTNITSEFTLFLAVQIQPTDTVAVTAPAGLVQIADGNGGFVLSPACSTTLTNGQSLYAAGTSQNLSGKGYRALMAAPNIGPKVNLKRYGWNRDTPIASVAPNTNNLWQSSVPAFGTPNLTPAMLTADGYPTSSAPLPVSFDFNPPGTGGGNPVDNVTLPVDAGKYTVKYQATTADDWTWDDPSAVKLGSTNTGSEFVDVWALPPGRSLKGKVRAAGVSNVRVTHAKTTPLDSQFGHPLSLMQCQGAKVLRYMIADDIPSTGVQHYSEYGQATARGFANDGTACSDVYNITNWETLDAAHVGNYGGQMVYRVTFDRSHSLLDAAFTTLGATDSSGNPVTDPTVPILHLTFTGTLKAGVPAGTATSGSMVIGPTSPGVVVASQLARSGLTLAANQCYWATGALFTDSNGNLLNPTNYDDFTVTVAFPQAGAGTTLRLSRAFERVPAPDLWCNDVNQIDDCWLWVNIPPAADDALVHTLAQKIAAKLLQGRKAVVEYGNEVWNSADPYFTTQFCYGIKSWDTLVTTGDPFQTVTPRIVAIHNIFVEEFAAAGRPSTDVVRMFGSFAASATPTFATCTYLANNGLPTAADAFCLAPYVTAGPNGWIANPYGLSATVTAVGTNAFTVDHANFNAPASAFTPVPTTGLPLYFDVTRSGVYQFTKAVTGVTAGSGSTGVLATAGTYNRGKQSLPAYDASGTGIDSTSNVQVGDVITPNIQGVVNQLTIDEVVDMRTRSLADSFYFLKGQVDAHLSSIHTLLGSGWPGFIAGYEGGVTGCDLSDSQFMNALYSQAMVHDPSGYWVDLWYHDALDNAGYEVFAELYLCGGYIGEQGYATTYNKYQWPGMAPGVGDGSDGLFDNRGVLRAWLDSVGNPVGNPVVMPLSDPLVSPFGAATNLTNALCGLPSGCKHVLTGPVSGVQGSPVGPFTVTLLDGVTLGSGVTLVATVAVSDPDTGAAVTGTWTGSNVVTLSDSARSGQTAGSWTPASPGAYTPTNAGTVAFTAAANAVVSGTPTPVPTPPRLRATVLSAQPNPAYLIVAPPSGNPALTPGTPSGSYSVSIGPLGVIPSGNVNITVSDNGVGGTFTIGFNTFTGSAALTPLSSSNLSTAFTWTPPAGYGGTATFYLTDNAGALSPARVGATVTGVTPTDNLQDGHLDSAFATAINQPATTLAESTSAQAVAVVMTNPSPPAPPNGGDWFTGSAPAAGGFGQLGDFTEFNDSPNQPPNVSFQRLYGGGGGTKTYTVGQDGDDPRIPILRGSNPLTRRGGNQDTTAIDSDPSTVVSEVAFFGLTCSTDQVNRISLYFYNAFDANTRAQRVVLVDQAVYPIGNFFSNQFAGATAIKAAALDPSSPYHVLDLGLVQGQDFISGRFVSFDSTGSFYVVALREPFPVATKVALVPPPTPNGVVGTTTQPWRLVLDGPVPSGQTYTVSVHVPTGVTGPGTIAFTGNQTVAEFTLLPTASVASGNHVTTSNDSSMNDATPVAFQTVTAASTVTVGGYAGPATIHVGDSVAFTIVADGPSAATATPQSTIDFTFTPSSVTLNGTTPVSVTGVANASGSAAITAYNNAALANAGEVDVTVSGAAVPTLTVTPATATSSSGGSTVAVVPTLSNSSAALTRSVSGGGTVPTGAPLSGVPFNWTQPASGSGVAVVTVSDPTDSLSATCTITYTGAAVSLQISGPTSVVAGNTYQYSVAASSAPSGVTVVTPSTTLGGTFSPPTLTFTPTRYSGTFQYTAPAAGSGNVGVTNNGGLTNPAALAVTSTNPTAATLTLSGPSSGFVGQPSTAFTVAAANLDVPRLVYLFDGQDGHFTPGVLSFPAGSSSQTFTYTAKRTGTYSISVVDQLKAVTPSGSPVAFTAAPSVVVTGPTSGYAEYMSAPFTLAGTGLAGNVTVTPSDNSGGGTFSPSTVTLSAGTPTATISYTPPAVGNYSLSFTGAGGTVFGGPVSFSAQTIPTVRPLVNVTVPLSGTAVLLFPAERGATRYIQNFGAKDVIIGNASVSSNSGNPVNGFVVKGNQTAPQIVPLDDALEYWAVSGDGSDYENYVAMRQ